ncbi:hypothetical protein LCGC14_1586260 [marine sediment metagenome]|uniref:Uncharacterized protein n=1 Tax=marine sediment metagenome TaxID=412755 RepID=A0A0F9IFA5_9ZZZZ
MNFPDRIIHLDEKLIRTLLVRIDNKNLIIRIKTADQDFDLVLLCELRTFW